MLHIHISDLEKILLNVKVMTKT